MLAVAGAWVALLGAHGGLGQLTLPPAHELGTQAGQTGAGGDAAIAAALAALPMWALMSVAMMVPATLPAVRHVGMNSLRWRRQRAVTEFVAAYVGVWVAFGVLALAVASFMASRLDVDVALAVALSAAAIWQLLPYQRHFLRACHRTVPLPPTGWRAAAGCARFGLRHGRACLGACWPLMLVMALALHLSVLWMVALTAIVSTKKLLPRSDRLSRPLAVVLAAVALTVLLDGPARALDATTDVSIRHDHRHPEGAFTRPSRQRNDVASRLRDPSVETASAHRGAATGTADSIKLDDLAGREPVLGASAPPGRERAPADATDGVITRSPTTLTWLCRPSLSRRPTAGESRDESRGGV